METSLLRGERRAPPWRWYRLGFERPRSEDVSSREGASPGADSRLRAATLGALGALIALAALLRFRGLGAQGFWFDEARTAWLVHTTPAKLLGALPHTESNPPLYYLLAWGWVRLFGDTETGLRSLSALAGVLTVPVAYLAGRALATRRVGLAAAALVAVNPLLVWYSQEARSYALVVLFAALSFWLFCRTRARPTPKALACWAGASALALCTHYFAVFLILPEALLLLAARQPSRAWRLGAVAAVGAVGLAMIPMAYRERSHAPWIGRIPLGTRLDQIVHQFLVGFPPAAGPAAVVVAGIAVAAALGMLALRANPAERRAAALAAAVGVPTVALPLVLAVAGVDYLNTRNVIAALVPLAVVAAAGFGARRAGLAGLAAMLMVAAASLSVVVSVAAHPADQKLHLRQVAAALGPTRAPRAVLLDSASTFALSLAFYRHDIWWSPPGGARVAEIDVLRKLPPVTSCRDDWWGSACHYGGRPPLHGPPARGFRLVSSHRVGGFQIARYRASRPIRIYPHQPFETRPRPGFRPASRNHLLLSPERPPVLP